MLINVSTNGIFMHNLNCKKHTLAPRWLAIKIPGLQITK